tara:strand:- start:342 stop:497 length:156 start_codon:yes stop_codon:yes gene_type:complete
MKQEVHTQEVDMGYGVENGLECYIEGIEDTEVISNAPDPSDDACSCERGND